MKKKIYESIDALTVNIKSKEHYTDFEDITNFYERRFLKRQNKTQSLANRYKSNLLLAKKLDELEAKNKETVEVIAKKTAAYKQLIKKYKLRNWLVEKPSWNLLKIVKNKLLLLVGFPLFVYGFIFNALPFFAIDKVTRKKIKEVAFWNSFFYVLALVFFPLFYLIELAAVASLLPGIWLKLAFLFSLPFAGKIAFSWYIIVLKNMGRGRLLLLKFFSRKKYAELIGKRDELFENLDRLIST